jgi:hypothetical protein
LAALVVLGVSLAAVGLATVRGSTAGKRVNPSTDPAAPGFEAFVTPTPTMLVVGVHDGALSWVGFLALGAGDTGGSVVLVPPSTLGDYAAYGDLPLDGRYRAGGASNVARGVSGLLDIALDEVVTIDDAQWARLAGTIGSLTFDIPDGVVSPEGTAFAAGTVTLRPDQVAEFLAATAPGESDLNRMARVQTLVEAYLAALRRGGAAAIPGESDSGIGGFLRVLSAGTPTTQVLPVGEVVSDRGSSAAPPAFVARDTDVAELVASIVPLPVGPFPGVRPRVRLLNGTTDRRATGLAAQVLVRGLAEITILGNAEHFGLTRTQVAYYDPSFESRARGLARALGGAKVVRDDRSPASADIIDVTVRIGTDFTQGG